MAKLPERAFLAGELDPALHERVDLSQYQYGLKLCENFFVRPQGGLYNRAGMRYIGEVKDSTKATRLIPFQFNTEQTYILEFGNLYIRIIQNGVYLESAPSVPLEVVTPYLAAELFEIQFNQSADTLRLVQHNHPPADLVREAALTWTLTNVDYGISAGRIPANVVLTPKGTTAGTGKVYKYVVTSTDLNGVESLVSIEKELEVVAALTNEIAIEVSWDAVADTEFYTVYKDTGTGNLVYGFIGYAKTTLFNDFNVSPDVSLTPPQDNKPFASDYPGVVGLYQQRQLYGNTVLFPQNFYASQTGIYDSMRRSSPLRDTDSITFTIASKQIDEIRHILDLESLVIMTAGAIYPVSEGADFVLTPSTISARARTYVGASKVPPAMIIDSIIYVTEKGNRLRDMMNNKDVPGDGGVDLTLLSYHLFKDRSVVEMTYAHEPYNILWCVMSDGQMLALTYEKQQQIWAWHRHVTDGFVESITSVTEDGRDAVYAVVKRNIDGADVRYVERIEKRVDDTPENAFFVDAGFTYSGVSTTTITGLDHLEGEAVAVLADGNVVKDLTVALGTIELPRAATTVQVGLPYEATVQTLGINTGEPDSYDSRKDVSRVIISFLLSRGGFVGKDLIDMNEIRPRFQSDGYDTIQPKTYETDVAIDPDWDSEGSIYFQQRDPLPVAILSITPEYDMSD